MIGTLALALAITTADGPLPGRDKVKHFFMSAFVHSIVFSAARSAQMVRSDAQLVAGVATMSLGILKELHDRKAGRPFSTGDLAWDAAGALAAAAILNGTLEQGTP
jgi:uncharacterized protein YfiM (DUF2279 family)